MATAAFDDLARRMADVMMSWSEDHSLIEIMISKPVLANGRVLLVGARCAGREKPRFSQLCWSVSTHAKTGASIPSILASSPGWEIHTLYCDRAVSPCTQCTHWGPLGEALSIWTTVARCAMWREQRFVAELEGCEWGFIDRCLVCCSETMADDTDLPQGAILCDADNCQRLVRTFIDCAEIVWLLRQRVVDSPDEGHLPWVACPDLATVIGTYLALMTVACKPCLQQ